MLKFPHSYCLIQGVLYTMNALFSYRDGEIYAHHTIDMHPDPEQFTIHAHEWMEVLYIISGKGSYLIEGVQYPLEPEDIFIIRPGEMHKLNIDPSEPYERIAIHFAPESLTPIDPVHTLLDPFNDRNMGRLNRYTLSEDPDGLLRVPLCNFKFDNVPNVRLNLFARLIQFLTHLDNQFHIMKQNLPAETRNELVRYVYQHLFEDISVQSVADEMHLSRSQVNRIFQQVTGTSMWKYVTAKRLLAARAMIQRGESAYDASAACGFFDYSSFYRAYRSYFGHSPREDA